MDDLIIATKTPEEMQEVKQLLSLQFQMKDMGELHYCLGITIEQDKAEKSIHLHQKQYHLKMLKLEDAKPVSTPADPNVKLRKDDGVSKAVDLTYRKSDKDEVLGYSDADYTGDVDDRHSTTVTGNLFLMSGGPISWLSKKQPIVHTLCYRSRVYHLEHSNNRSCMNQEAPFRLWCVTKSSNHSWKTITELSVLPEIQ